MSILSDAFETVVGVVSTAVTTVVSEVVIFAEYVVAAGAQVLNDFLNSLAGPAALDKEISEFSTQNTYLFTDDAYIDNLHNTDRIALNSLIKGTSITDEIIDFYRKEGLSSDFHLGNALDIVEGNDITYCPASHGIVSNFAPITGTFPFIGYFNFNRILPSVTLRVNNTNLFEGSVPAEYDSSGSDFIWHSFLTPDFGYVNIVELDEDDGLAKAQTNTKDYLKALGMLDPENLLDDLPYTTSSGAPGGSTYSDVIDSAFINFRVKWVSGLGGADGNRISNKYLWLLASKLYYINSMPHVLTYDNDEGKVWMFQYEVIGDGHNYTMGMSHISRSVDNPTSHTDYEYNKDLTSSDGYYYYDTNKNLLGTDGYFSANTVAEVQAYLDYNLGASFPYEEVKSLLYS